MTTRVLIVNHGPESVVVTVVDGVALPDKGITIPTGAMRQKVGAHTEYSAYVHDGASLIVAEVKDAK
jgi:hypothetical protein